MIYAKTSPVGLDIKINSIQNKLHAALLDMGLVTGDVDVYPRIYKQRDDKIEPVKFISKEFERSLFTTDKKVVAYFYERFDAVNTHGLFSSTVANIVHVNLPLVYPSITHRPDHEFIKFMTDIYKIEPYGFRLDSIATGVNVFTDFSNDFKREDIPPYFSVRFDLNINYRI